MKTKTLLYSMLVLITIWVSSACAIGIGLYYTRDIRCLWFLLIPVFSGGIRIKTTTQKDESEETL